MSEQIKEPSLQDILSKSTQALALKAYRIAATKKEIPVDEIYHSGVCEVVSEAMARELSAMYGANVHLLRYDRAGVVALHQFLRIKLGDEVWIIDPTWQQFLNRPDRGKPQVLCVRESDLPETLSKNGVSQVAQLMWKEAHEVPVPEVSIWE